MGQWAGESNMGNGDDGNEDEGKFIKGVEEVAIDEISEVGGEVGVESRNFLLSKAPDWSKFKTPA